MFTLRLLGTPSVEGSDGPLVGRVIQRRRLALLALLVFARKEGRTREKLISVLWPDREPYRAYLLLDDSVDAVNTVLDADAILVDGEVLHVNDDVLQADVCRFEDAISARDLETAATVYQGPLLHGFSLPEMPEFERWVGLERERLARRYRGVLESLAKQRAEKGDRQGAVEAWRLLAQEDPLNPWVTTRLMLALEATGDYDAALLEADAHASLMREEYGTEADPEVTALARRLRAAPRPAPAAAAGTAPPVPSQPPAAAPPRRRLPSRAWRVAAGVVLASMLVLGGVWAVASRPTTPATATPARNGLPTIAVLPFENRTADGEDDYLSDGMTDELINALSRVPGLRVTARTSSFAFKGTNKDVREIARDLGVSAVLEGSVRQAGDRLRVTAQLTNAVDGYNLWSATYERQAEDVFAIQDEISQAIVRALEVELVGRRNQPLVGRGTDNLTAYTQYLKGRYFWNERVRDRERNLRRSVAYYQAALQADPNYARAYAGLADSYASLASHIPREQAYQQAQAAAERAVALDPNSAEALGALGRVLVFQNWDWAGAERAFRKAIDLQPGDAAAHQRYGMHLVSLGQTEPGLAELQRARELDPLSVAILLDLGRASYYARKPDQAIRYLESALELEPTSADAHLYIGLAHVEARRWDQARAAFRRWAALTGEEPAALLAYIDAAAGRREEAERALRALRAPQVGTGDSEVSAASLAVLHAALGQQDSAFNWLDQAIAERSPFVLFLKVNPRIDPLRSDPRFPGLLRKVGLPA